MKVMRIKYTYDLLQSTVCESNSVSDVIRRLGLRESGGNHSHIKKRIAAYGIDISHFKKNTEFLRPGINKRSPEQILVLREVGRREPATCLRRAMIESGIEYKCVSCMIGNHYNGFPIVLEVNHKNSNWLDNRKENIEFLCPNCHSQYHKAGMAERQTRKI